MIARRELDAALTSGHYRLGRRNVRLVRCAACGAGCLPGQARALHLLTRLWRAVWLCASCEPKEGQWNILGVELSDDQEGVGEDE